MKSLAALEVPGLACMALVQIGSEERRGEGTVLIIKTSQLCFELGNGNSSMLSEHQVGYSPIDSESLGLDFEIKSCHYWI